MDKTLIIAEKPSVAADIVKALPGRFTKTKTHFESDAHIVSYALGHLVTIAFPEEIDPRFQKWNLENLPILPEEFPLNPIPGTKAHFNALQKLIRRRDVGEIVNACDAGREGELIFKYILKVSSNRSVAVKKIRRLWLQSMTQAAIRDGLARLRDNAEMLPLENTALCRSESDWLIGINATRALTAYNSRFGGFRKTPCGRVQTPTLSMIVKRENERRGFVPQTYYELHGTFSCTDINYTGVWIDPDFKKDSDNPDQRQDRIRDRAKAGDIVQRCRGREAEVSESSKESSQGCPQLFDLTSLQRDANNRFGFSAQNTLGLVQALYERHKLVTYPRTDSRHLPEDYIPTVKEVLAAQQQWQFGQFAGQALANNYVRKNPKIFDNAKVSDHFAIIPTTGLAKKLSEAELKIYQMIVQRFIAVFFPPAEYLNTRRLSIVAGETFLTEGKILVRPGWRAVYGTASSGKDDELQALPPGATTVCSDIEQKENQTKPPPRYTEATLLSAMEHSGKLVEDEELAEAMKERGLGTPATRAAIIEKLIKDKYLVREARDLAPTGKAFELLALIESMGIDVLASPELTGEWEYKLNQILKGGMTRDEFMAEIRKSTGSIIQKIKGFREEAGRLPEAPFSPVDGLHIYETSSAYVSGDEKTVIRKILGGRVMAQQEIVDLLQGKVLGPFSDFRSKQGKPFTASVRLAKGKVEFIFAESDDQLDIGDVKQSEPLGLSPIDRSPVYETPAAYISASALDGDKKNGLRVSKMILSRHIERQHMAQLLKEGRTELIKGFVSKRKKPFDAYLLLDNKGKITFEFPPRERKGKKKNDEKNET